MESSCKLFRRGQFRRGQYVDRILVVFAFLCFATLQSAAGQSFTIQDLGTLPGGFVSHASAINEHGEVVGDSATNGLFQPHAFLFRHGGLDDLGTLPSGNFSSATGINKHGQVVGFSGRHGRIRVRFFI